VVLYSINGALMDIQETLDIMNSDFKLWERATGEDLGGGKVTKTINLPWGIGEVTVTLEGMTDATKRRGAVSSYGEYIRGLIDEQTNDEAITSRAQVHAANAQPTDSESGADSLGGGPERVREPSVQEGDVPQAGQAHKEHATRPVGLREILTARKVEIDDEVEYFTERRDTSIEELIALAQDLKAVEAGLAALGDDNGDQ